MMTQITTPYPERFREGEADNRKRGRALALITRQSTPDPAVIDTIGRRLFARDEAAAALVRAMRSDGPDRVSMRQFHQALRAGIDGVPDAPAPLRQFFAVVDEVPDWVDPDLLEAGGRALRRLGPASADVLLQLSLINGYRYGGPTDLLVETGGLTGNTTRRRLGETQKWTVAIAQPGAMRRDGEGFALTVHVRVMHALVNHQFETNGRWDTRRWGLPINQSDQAATLGLFSGVLLLGVRLLGVRVPAADSAAIMHLWKYIGWLMGVDEDWLCDSEWEQHRFNYHQLITQSRVSAAGPPLANSVVEIQRELEFGRFGRLRGAYTRARLLGMLRYFLGRAGMRDLELPRAVPWSVPGTVAANVVRYQTLTRFRAGRRYLERRGDRHAARILTRYFGSDTPDVGPLEARPRSTGSRARGQSRVDSASVS